MFKQLIIRTLFFVLCTLPLISPSTTMAEEQHTDVVQAFNDVLLQSMQQGQALGFDGRFGLIRPVYEDTFAWQAMARFAAGKFWSTLSPEDRKAYLHAYRDWSVATYADRFHTYKGQKFAVLPPEKDDGRRVAVVSRLTKSNGDEVDLTYKLRSRGKAWQVVDIHVRGVSQLAMTRSQFVSVLEDQGLPALLNQLKEKTMEMSQDVSS